MILILFKGLEPRKEPTMKSAQFKFIFAGFKNDLVDKLKGGKELSPKEVKILVDKLNQVSKEMVEDFGE